ncbi:MAG: adenosine kinase [Alphaproteobacteria bacterium]|nr:MAG: adenosine kinase [Alphaproteobacteria bacterium]
MNSTSNYAFAVLGNAVVDGIAHVDDALLARFSLKKGDSNTLSHAQMLELSNAITVEQFRAGGAAANTAYTLAKLGSRIAFIGQIGTDPTGRFFVEDMLAAGITLTPPMATSRTTDIFTLLADDGTRTMVQCLPPAPSTDDSWIDDNLIEQANYLIIESYVVASHPAAVEYAARHATHHGKRLVVSLASPRAVQACLPVLTDIILTHTPLIIGNQSEWEVLLKGNDPHTSKKLEVLERVITRSGNGAAYYAANGGAVVDSPTQPIPRPTDLTGAGDAFAAGFLHVFMGGGSPQLALQQGHQLGRAVVLQLGPRLQSVPEVTVPHSD